MKKTVKAWAVLTIEDNELCFATEETYSPLAVFSEEFEGEISAKVLAREIEGSKAVRCEIIYSP